jgi:hypothetical protein
LTGGLGLVGLFWLLASTFARKFLYSFVLVCHYFSFERTRRPWKYQSAREFVYMHVCV